MSRYYRALVRVFGTTDAVLAAHKAFLATEMDWPSHEFSCEWLSLAGQSDETRCFVMRAELSRRAPGIAFLDLAAGELALYPQLMVERLVDDDDRETWEVWQAGKSVYRAGRQEVTGDEYELGAPGLHNYCYGHEEGIKNAMQQAMKLTGITKPLPPL
jgi:hypothetical protein